MKASARAISRHCSSLWSSIRFGAACSRSAKALQLHDDRSRSSPRGQRRRAPARARRARAAAIPERIRQSFCNRGALGRIAAASLAATLPVWTVRGTIVGYGLHGATRVQSPLLAVPDPTGRGPWAVRAEIPRRPMQPVRRDGHAAGSDALEPAAYTFGADRFPRRTADHGRQWRSAAAKRLRHPSVRCQSVDANSACSTTPTASC